MDGEQTGTPAADAGTLPPIDNAGDAGLVGGTVADTPPESTPGVPDNGTDPAGAPDDYADLYDKLDDETVDPANPNAQKQDQHADPNAPPPPFSPDSLPEPMRAMFTGDAGEYIKTPEHAAQAAQAATEIWNVQTGKADAWSMVEAVRQYNPERYQSLQMELARGLATANPGWQFVKLNEDGTVAQRLQTQQEDPRYTAMQREFSEMKQKHTEREQAEARQKDEQAQAQFRSRVDSRMKELTDGTFIQSSPSLIHAILSKMDENNVDVSLAKTNYDEWQKQFDRAFKQVKNAKIDELKEFNKNVIQHRQRLRAATPATPGSGAANVPGGTSSGEPQRSQFPEGEDGTRDWRAALYKFHMGE